jgi:putative hydrolase of the HAD superfamily
VAQAVIFDWFGTLAEWPHGSTSNYASVFLRHGHSVKPAVFDRHHTRWDGVDHAAHSVSREAYAAWTRERLLQLTVECGVAVSEREILIDALVEVDQRTSLVVFPDTAVVLGALRRRNLRIGVCSNWGWDLAAALDATGVTPLVDVAVTSARAGYRKPHGGIYESVLDALGVASHDAVFVGDSWEPDVLGPITAGMRSVHICRNPGTDPLPELVTGAYRIGDLHALLELGILDE